VIINPTSGSDTWIDEDHPNRPHASGNTIRLQASERKGGIHIPLTNIRGLVVTSAVLIGRVKAGFVAQHVTAHLPIEKWKTQKTTWNHAPDLGMSVTTILSGSFSDGDAVELDILEIATAVADGSATWRGLFLTTNATGDDESLWYAFDSGKPSWELLIEAVDPVEQPTELHPSGDYIGTPTPNLSWRPTQLGGSAAAMGGFQIQADPDADEVSPAFDTGWVTGVQPFYPLADDGDWTDLTVGGVLRWRVRSRDASGVNESEWSDWTDASEYQAMPVLVVDSPTGGVIGDSTPILEAHMTGETMTTWRARVLDAGLETLWDSGLRDGPFEIEVPFRDPDTKRRILKHDDASYRVDLRAWGTRARADMIGFPSYVRQVVDVTYDDDLGVTAPDSLTVASVATGDPRLLFTWHRSTAADAWLIFRDDEIVARLDSDDVTVVSGTYSWTDYGLSQPYNSHEWKVRAVDDGDRSAASNTVTYTTKPRGFWLIPVDLDIDPIVLKGVASLDQFGRADRVATYQPPATGFDVNIYYSQEGVSGQFDGTIADEAGLTRHALADARRINNLAEHTGATVQLVWANMSIPAELTNLAALPHSTFDDANRRQRVTFTFKQNGD